MDSQSPNLLTPNPLSPITITGNRQPSGAYILRIRLHEACDVVFGRFDQGRPVALPGGDYLYVGSAMGKRGSSTLANRLLRHARRADTVRTDTARADTDRAQPIYADLEAFFSDIGWSLPPTAPTRTKTLRWHIDYLLERPEATLTQIYIACSPVRFESALAVALLADPATSVVVPGLGASDDRGSTHLLLVEADEQWWQKLPERMIPPSS